MSALVRCVMHGRFAVIAVAIGLVLSAPWVRAADEDVLKKEIDGYVDLANSGQHKAVIDGVLSIKKKVEDSRDFVQLARLYQLLSFSGRKLGNRQLSLRGDFQSAILWARAYGPREKATAMADTNLADTYDQRKLQRAVLIAASNGLNSIRLLKQDGQGDAELDQEEAYAHQLLGTAYERAGRNEMALRHFRIAVRLGANGVLAAREQDLVSRAVARLEPSIGTQTDGHVPGSCRAGPALDEERGKRCLQRSDRAQFDGDTGLAEVILRELVADAMPDRVPVERVPALLALHMLLLERHAPEDAEVIATVDMLGNKLAAIDFGAAALLSMRTVVAVEKYEKRLIDLCGHIARRAARGGDEDLALRFLDVQLVLLSRTAKTPKAKADEKLLRPLMIEHSLLLFEAASFARLNDYAGLAQIYDDAAEPSLDRIASIPFDELETLLADYWDPKRGFVFPAQGGAAELLGRIAARDPTTRDRQQAILNWIAGETVWRNDEVRARKLIDDHVAKVRRLPGQESFLADLLKWKADNVDDPVESGAIYREAYNLIRNLPDAVPRQIRLLIDMVDNSRSAGDGDTALRLLDEAEALAAGRSVADPNLWSQIHALRAEFARDEADVDAALALQEKALAVLADSGKRWQSVGPARALADLYALTGRLDEARRLYETYVFPVTSNALDGGDAQELSARTSLMALEAFYSPTEKTIAEIEKLDRHVADSAGRDNDLRRRVVRAATFAHYGLGHAELAIQNGRKALSMRRTRDAEKTGSSTDRVVLEAMVGAATMLANGPAK